MKTLLLFALTAIVTGLHNFYMLMGIVNGAPLSLLSCAALLGSATLLVAAVLAPSHMRDALRAGLAGSLLLWIFYAPLIVVSASMPYTTWLNIRFDLKFHDYVPIVGTLGGPMMLIICTVYVLWTYRREA